MDLEHDRIPSLLAKFSIPAITGMVVNALYNVVDRIFIGQGVGSTAFSSLTVTMPLAIVILAFAMLVGIGCAPLISIALGEKRKDEAERVLGNGIALLVILSLLITAAGLAFMHPVLIFLGGSEETLGYAEEYMRVIYCGVIFQMLGFGMIHMMRASGNPRASMQTMLLGAILNTLLDPVFIFWFGWGIRGAAYATIIAQAASMLYVLYYFMGPKSHLTIHPKYFRVTPGHAWRIFSVGVSAFATQIGSCLVIAVANQQIRTHGGDAALGAMGIINSFAMLFLMPVFGLNQGAQPIVGYNYGAKQYDRVRLTLKYTGRISALICLLGWLVVESAPGLVIGLFTQDAELSRSAWSALRIFFMFLPLVGPQIIFTVYFQAIGQAKRALWLSMLRQIIILIPMYLLLPRFFGLTGVWLAAPVTDCLSFVITLAVFSVNIRRLGVEVKPESGRRGDTAQALAIEEFEQDLAASQPAAALQSQSARFVLPTQGEVEKELAEPGRHAQRQ